MGKYLLKRILHLIPVLIIVSIVMFGITKLMPGDPVTAIIGEAEVTPQKVEQIRALYGLDKSYPEQYAMWIERSIKGDFGDSVQYRQPVTEVMGNRIMNSFILNITAIVIALAIAIPLGITTAVKKYSLFDNVMTTVAMIGISLPSFFLALILIYIFGAKLRVLPMSGMITAGSNYTGFKYFWDVVQHMILPVSILAFGSVASYTRYIRSAMTDVIKMDYIRTARSKGLTEKVVIYKHAFRNALLPVVTLIIMGLPSLFAGSIVIETYFQWPGIGRVMYASVTNRDFNLMLASNMFFVFLMLGSNVLADIVAAFLDPRIKLE
ncbi:MAG: ABC transporter permease [Lachnospirales bacterium]